MIIGVDIGGTFTDLALSVDGRLHIHKVFSTPHAPEIGMLAGLEALAPGLNGIQRVAHGSTVATNAILERRGARAALITTQGFRDVLFIGRQNRPDSHLYALQPRIPPPLIPRERCYEVPERLDHTGAVLIPLDLAALDAVIDQIAASEVEAVAVCFLYSYLNPAHEQAVRARIGARGLALEVVLSCEVLPEFREYERASTVALETYVRPVMSRYLGNLEARLPCPLRIMKSDGGVISAAAARRQAIQTALSGPAAGVIGAFHIAQQAGYNHIITLDIGGTSTDVSLCPGAPIRHPEREIDGLPLRIRLLDIETIGAGGGSIARLDAGGALRVGPESAGADPGSVIYGRGGQRITVSDANAVLGRLDAAHFLGGTLPLDLDGARRALAPLAAAMHRDPEAAAAGIIQVANANIDRALRRVSVARGHDPRGFTLVAFGGAGPLHACEVAERLSIPRVLVPRYPGVMCAVGLLVADVVLDYSRAVLGLPESRLASLIAEMVTAAQDDLVREGLPTAAMMFYVAFDMRYRGQAYELTIPYAGKLSALPGAFHEAHRRRYGHALPDRDVEIVSARVQAVGAVEKPIIAPETVDDHTPTPEGEAITSRTPLYERAHLRPGAHFNGPALVTQLDSTTYLAPGWSARVDGWRNLLLERS